MAQVVSPNVKKDDTLDTAMAGLQIYNGVQSLRNGANAKASMPTASLSLSPTYYADDASEEAMRRRLQKLSDDRTA